MKIQIMLEYTREDCKKRLGLDLEIDTTQEWTYLDQWLEMQKNFSHYWSLHREGEAPVLRFMDAWYGDVAD